MATKANLIKRGEPAAPAPAKAPVTPRPEVPGPTGALITDLREAAVDDETLCGDVVRVLATERRGNRTKIFGIAKAAGRYAKRADHLFHLVLDRDPFLRGEATQIAQRLQLIHGALVDCSGFNFLGTIVAHHGF